MQFINQITLLYPLFLLLIPLYILCEIFCKRNLQNIVFSNVAMLQKATRKQYSYIKILRFTIVALLSLALASPVIKNQHSLNNALGYDISLVIDASSSMYEDNRFNITKNIVSEFIDKRPTDKIALSVFADFSFVAVPLTYDKKSIKELLKYLKIGVAGSRNTSLYEALYLGADIFKKSQSKNKIIILLTDGINTVDTIKLSTALKKVQKHNIKVYTIAVGQNGDYDKDILTNIAKITDGKFYETSKPEKLKTIYEQINKLEKSKIKTTKYIQNIHYFQYLVTVSLILLILYTILHKNKYNLPYLIVSIVFIALVLSRPTISSEPISISRDNTSIMVAFDISASMQCNDIYPSRFAFMQKKFYDLTEKLSNQKVGVLGFSNQAYLITPTTNDYETLKHLVSNINLKHINKKGSNLIEVLKSTNNILSDEDKKALIVFTDGTNKANFTQEIKYAKKHNITVYIYTIATKKGGIITINKKILKDENDNIVITSLNDSIKTLATQTNGLYKSYSLNSDDLNLFINDINKNLNNTKQSSEKISNDKELFYIPLVLGLLTFVLSVVRLRDKKI